MPVPLHTLLNIHPDLKCEEISEYRREISPSSLTPGISQGWDVFFAIPSKERKGYVHRWMSLNAFQKIATRLPDGFKKRKIGKTRVIQFCDPTRTLLRKDNAAYRKIRERHIRDKAYFTHDNGVRPYLVYVSSKDRLGKRTVSIYRRSPRHFFLSHRPTKWKYTQLVKRYTSKRTFIGSDTGRPARKGNTILLQLGAQRYVHISGSVYEFETPAKSDITRYESDVGNNDVPYPIAYGEPQSDGTRFIYYMAYHMYASVPADGKDYGYGWYHSNDDAAKHLRGKYISSN